MFLILLLYSFIYLNLLSYFINCDLFLLACFISICIYRYSFCIARVSFFTTSEKYEWQVSFRWFHYLFQLILISFIFIYRVYFSLTSGLTNFITYKLFFPKYPFLSFSIFSKSVNIRKILKSLRDLLESIFIGHDLFGRSHFLYQLIIFLEF